MRINSPETLERLHRQLQGCRYLICLDLEATCDEYPSGMAESEREHYPLIVPADEMETIELGVVVIDLQRKCKQIDEFDSFVKPWLHPVLSPFCTQLTTITQDQVDAADTYDEVRVKFDAFIGSYLGSGVVWCSWGDYDRLQLEADARRTNTTPMLQGVPHVNVDQVFTSLIGSESPDLKTAVEAAGLRWSGQYHRGIDDAKNIARLMAKLLNRNVSPSQARGGVIGKPGDS
ncbi:3'-5' exonuclease [Pseudomonas bohemica]|uniref:3'-5' exonuclease n=1 Tax=Pseudomonas bohemica TaxID=2044872 RepID=UPI000DA621D6|nr:3'-5' exonuclease [Pseudomonas bohemica]